MTTAALPDLEALVGQLRGELFARFLRRAQKAALLEWRDRRDPPGLLARFTAKGIDYYRFGRRGYDAKSPSRRPPYFHKEGGLEAQMKVRKPRSKRSQTEVVTSLKFGGGVLNMLTGVFPVRSLSSEAKTESVSIDPYTRLRQGKTVSVRGYERQVTSRKVIKHRGGRSMAEEFGDFSRDRRFIAEAINRHFMAIYRKAALTKKGQLRSAVFEKLDSEGG
jgi:hypothetical protein